MCADLVCGTIKEVKISIVFPEAKICCACRQKFTLFSAQKCVLNSNFHCLAIWNAPWGSVVFWYSTKWQNNAEALASWQVKHRRGRDGFGLRATLWYLKKPSDWVVWLIDISAEHGSFEMESVLHNWVLHNRRQHNTILSVNYCTNLPFESRLSSSLNQSKPNARSQGPLARHTDCGWFFPLCLWTNP